MILIITYCTAIHDRSFGATPPHLEVVRFAFLCAGALRFAHLIVSWWWTRKCRGGARRLRACGFRTGDVLTTSCVGEPLALLSQVLTMSPWGHVAVVVVDPPEHVRAAFAVSHWLGKHVKAHKWTKPKNNENAGGGGKLSTTHALLHAALMQDRNGVPPAFLGGAVAGDAGQQDALVGELFRAGHALGYAERDLRTLHAQKKHLKKLADVFKAPGAERLYGPRDHFDGPAWRGVEDVFVAEAVKHGVRIVPIARWMWFWYCVRQERVAWRSLADGPGGRHDRGKFNAGCARFLLETAGAPYV